MDFSVSVPQVSPYGSHQFVDRQAAVITCHVGVEVLPSPLDLVVVRAVGREEAQLDSLAFRGLQRGCHLLRMVDRIVIKDNVDHFGLRMFFELTPTEAE